MQHSSTQSNRHRPRAGEIEVALPETTQAGLYFIGTLNTPFRTREECPRQGSPDGPPCRIEIDPRWRQGLEGLRPGMEVQVLYWMHEARRDLVVQNPGHRGDLVGTFSVRSPVRPNPIASSVVTVDAVEETALVVRGLDCLDGTPLLDLKPVRCPKAK